MKAQWPMAVANGWHPLAHAHELGRPLARTLMDVPVVLFHDGSGPVAFVDRCPHRNAPLSRGSIRAGQLVCAYHGWSFAASGRCVGVPGADAVPAVSARALPVRQAAGLVWVCLSPTPAAFPSLPRELQDDSTLDCFWWPLAASRGRLLDAIENLLDPAHPHFLHPNLVRRRNARRAVQVRFTSSERGAEARYIESSTRLAWLPRLFEGRRSASVGRYLAPTIAQLVFESDGAATLAITVVFVPETGDRTRPFTHFATRRGWLPAWVKRQLLVAFHIPVLRQDRRALAMQADTIERFSGPDFHQGPLDLFGLLIHRLAHGQPAPPEQRELQFWL